MTRRRKTMTAVLVAALVISACGAENADGPTSTEGNPVNTDEPTTTPAPDRGDRDLPNDPEPVPSDGSDTTVTGEVPDEFLQPVIDDAAERAGVDASAVTAITAQEMMWPDGSLDCPEPGGVYTQAPVSGYWVIVEAGGAAYDYRLGDSGFFKLCTSPFGGGSGGGSAPSS